jgi:RNA polymerase sigma-70 factor (ECF subfamily)
MKIRNFSDVEDIAMDAWSKINRHLEGYDPERSQVKTWVFMIVNTVILDHIKSKNLRSTREICTGKLVDDEGNDMFDLYGIDTQHTANKLVEGQELQGRLLRAFDGLKDNYRKVAEMYLIHDMSYNEIAEVLQMSLYNVQVTLFRAKKLLQAELQSTARQYNIKLA